MSFTTETPAPAPAPEPAAPRWRDVHLSSVARGVSVCGDVLAATALALFLQTRGDGGLAVAGVMIASTVPLVLLAPVAGRLADRVDSRTLLVAAGSLQVVACVALAYATHPLAIIGLVAVLAAGLAVTSPTLGALLPDMVGRDDLPKATAIGQMASSVGMLAGPALAGLLVGQFGVRVPLLIDAGTYLAIVAAGLFLRTRRGGRTAAAGEAPSAVDLQPAWRLRLDPLLLTVTVAIAVTIAAISAVNVVDVFFTRETLHASETMYGILGATWTATMLVGAWLAGRASRRAGDGRLAIVLFWLIGSTSITITLCATVPHVLWLVPLFIVGGTINGVENVLANLLVARRVPGAVRGRAIGMFVGILNAANVMGFLLGGVLLGVLTPRQTLTIAGVAGLIAVAICLPRVVRAVRREALVTNITPEPVVVTGTG